MLFGQKRRQVLVALLLGTSAVGMWLTWPWIVPLFSPVPTSIAGSDLVVVLDGGSGRFAAADRIGHALRLTLWRATGSTGAWLAPQVASRKRADCGV